MIKSHFLYALTFIILSQSCTEIDLFYPKPLIQNKIQSLSHTFSDKITFQRNQIPLDFFKNISSYVLIYRKNEINIYLALGERKLKIFYQLLLEILSISILGFTVAITAATFLAPILSQNILRQEMAAIEANLTMDEIWHTEDYSLYYNFIRPGEMTLEEQIESFLISLEAPVILFFYAIGLSTVTTATAFSTLLTFESNLK